MKIPNSILSKMRPSHIGQIIGGAGLALFLSGCGQAQSADVPNTTPSAPIVVKPATTVTTQQPITENPKVLPSRIETAQPKQCVTPAPAATPKAKPENSPDYCPPCGRG